MRKIKETYYVSTEGDNEVWYLEHLQDLINNSPNATKQVVIVAKKSKPLSFVKRIGVGYEESVSHICDFESIDEIERFKNDIDECEEAKKYKSLKTYNFHYSNLCFELWIILHKLDFQGTLSVKKKYLDYINKAYKTKIKSFDDVKKENVFKKSILPYIGLNDIISAIKKAKQLVANNKRNKHYESHKKVQFCRDNPDLNIHEFIEKILVDVDLM